MEKKCPVKTGFAVQSGPDCLSSQFRIECPAETGFGVQSVPNMVSTLLRITQYFIFFVGYLYTSTLLAHKRSCNSQTCLEIKYGPKIAWPEYGSLNSGGKWVMKECLSWKRGVIIGAVLALLVGTAGAADRLVVNGDFETGDFSGWTRGGDTSFTSVDRFSAHSGVYGADLGNVSYGSLLQMLDTEIGDTYTVSYWYKNRPVAISSG